MPRLIKYIINYPAVINSKITGNQKRQMADLMIAKPDKYPTQSELIRKALKYLLEYEGIE